MRAWLRLALFHGDSRRTLLHPNGVAQDSPGQRPWNEDNSINPSLTGSVHAAAAHMPPRRGPGLQKGGGGLPTRFPGRCPGLSCPAPSMRRGGVSSVTPLFFSGELALSPQGCLCLRSLRIKRPPPRAVARPPRSMFLTGLVVHPSIAVSTAPQGRRPMMVWERGARFFRSRVRWLPARMGRPWRATWIHLTFRNLSHRHAA
jgi:hypothetical protein